MIKPQAILVVLVLWAVEALHWVLGEWVPIEG